MARPEFRLAIRDAVVRFCLMQSKVQPDFTDSFPSIDACRSKIQVRDAMLACGLQG